MRSATFLFLVMLFPASAAPVAAHKQGAEKVDQLFLELKQASTAEEAKPIEDEIGTIFMASGSPSVDLLMVRAESAANGGDKEAARKLLDAITQIAPKFAEGWHRRAALQLAANDSGGAMVSLQRVILLNPREFRAMSELADLLDDYGDKAGALKLFRRAMALDPKLKGVAEHTKALETEVEGQRI